MTPISSPMAGDVHPLADVPDPVFAQGLVGPGVAIVPISEAEVTVVAPIAGRIVKLHPHAFVIQAEGVRCARPPGHRHRATQRSWFPPPRH